MENKARNSDENANKRKRINSKKIRSIFGVNLTKYDNVIEKLFFKKYSGKGNEDIPFSKDELISCGRELKINIRNVPDIIYTYRSRAPLPQKILRTGNWILQPNGKGEYIFHYTKKSQFIDLQKDLAPIEILNALPEIVEKYTANDEQGTLSSIRYNRLVDIFTEITCFHLQSHIRSTVNGEGQIEIDDLYVGIDRDGREYILPLEAKSPDERDKLGWVQVVNMVKYARQNYPKLKCRPICAKPIDKNLIYLIEFEDNISYDDIGIKNIKLYNIIRQNYQEIRLF